MLAGWFQETLDVSAADLDTSAGETGSVASGDDVSESVSSSVLAPLGRIADHLEDSDSSDVDQKNKENKEGSVTHCLYKCLLSCMLKTFSECVFYEQKITSTGENSWLALLNVGLVKK